MQLFKKLGNKEIKKVEFQTSFSTHQSNGESFDYTTGHSDHIQSENTYLPLPPLQKVPQWYSSNSTPGHQENERRSSFIFLVPQQKAQSQENPISGPPRVKIMRNTRPMPNTDPAESIKRFLKFFLKFQTNEAFLL